MADVVVLASGNLGLISFTKLEGRATLRDSSAPATRASSPASPSIPGIGFILVHSEELGPLAIGGSGVRYLVDDRVEGEDPLATFGPNCADHLRRTSSFVNAPDILVNSFYDPHADEGAAFEELIGFHGGLGGEQTQPFLLYPAAFPVSDEPIVGAAIDAPSVQGLARRRAARRLPTPVAACRSPRRRRASLPEIDAA